MMPRFLAVNLTGHGCSKSLLAVVRRLVRRLQRDVLRRCLGVHRVGGSAKLKADYPSGCVLACELRELLHLS